MGGERSLSVKIPTLFRCPISLDVMRSPVILSTGVTYDRSSIQRWLQSGHATCPATRQPLASTDLVPNLVLSRLIHRWSRDLLLSGHVTLDLFENADELEKNQLISAGGFAECLISHLVNNANGGDLARIEEAVRVASRIFVSDCIEEENKKILVQNLERAISSVILALKEGRNIESRTNAAVLIDAILSNMNPESRIRIADDVIPALIRLIGEDKKTNDVALSCLNRLSDIRSAGLRLVRSGIVPMLARILKQEADEKAMKLMEAAASCREGREAICEVAEITIPAILGKLLKFGRGGTESAVVVLWSVCYLFKDRRAQEAVVAGSGGLTKMLVVMQSDCSPTVRAMAGDLLKMFRVSCKGCVVTGYDTKTTHITPF